MKAPQTTLESLELLLKQRPLKAEERQQLEQLLTADGHDLDDRSDVTDGPKTNHQD